VAPARSLPAAAAERHRNDDSAWIGGKIQGAALGQLPLLQRGLHQGLDDGLRLLAGGQARRERLSGR
jgi:hypothetical protein